MNLASSQSGAHEFIQSELDDPRHDENAAGEGKRCCTLAEQDLSAFLAECKRRRIAPVDLAAALVEESELG